MAWGRTEDEKARERTEKEQARAAAEAEARRAADAAAQARAAAEYAASPPGRAAAAYQRGDAFFQLELDISALSGPTSFFGSSANAITSHTGAHDVLGTVEAQGWHLEHVGYVFVETGATTTNRVLGTGQGMVTQGVIRGIYLFRRAA